MTKTAVKDSEFQVLKNYAKAAADSIRKPLEQCTVGGYQNFLDTMYHYNLTAGQQMTTAAERSSTKELREYFLQQAKEEKGHYLLAQRDLESFGLTVSTQTPEAVLAFREYWDSIPQEKAAQYIGAVYLFENIAGHLFTEARGMMERLSLQKTQSRWLIAHLEVDQVHGAEAETLAKKYFPQFKDDILEGAEVFYKRWVNIFQDAFTESSNRKHAA